MEMVLVLEEPLRGVPAAASQCRLKSKPKLVL
jgi:hypothetical protein